MSTVDVSDFDSVADGAADDTAALQAAIDTCAKAGGGTVRVPAGRYRCGTLRLASRLTLRLDPGACLLGSSAIADYPSIQPPRRSAQDGAGLRALILAEDCEQIRITGGTIDGGGGAFAPMGFATDRPRGMLLRDCTRVRVDDLTLRNAGFWGLHLLRCTQARIHGVTVFNHAVQNNDGLDIESCRDVIVSGCFFDTGDDAICLKSGGDEPTENVVVGDCVIGTHANAIKLGTESRGGFRNIAIGNIAVVPSQEQQVICPGGRVTAAAGIALCQVDGGVTENVSIHHITMDRVGVPLFLRLGDRGGAGAMRDIRIAGVRATGAAASGCFVAGLREHPIERVTLQDIAIGFAGGGDLVAEPPENRADYPSMELFGRLPAYGLFLRDADDLTLQNLRLHLEAPDARPALYARRVARLRRNGVDLDAPASGEAALLHDCE